MDRADSALVERPDDATGLALRLALGTARGASGAADWHRVFDIASRELLAPLAWLRSGRAIRTHAPPEIARAWRRAGIGAHLRGQQQLDLLRDATARFREVGLDAVVLKGLPLGETLYGDPFVRCCADIDLFVPAPDRARASTALRSLGWRHVDGSPPWHETWTICHDDTALHLELHSSLVSDHLAHLPVGAPTAVTTTVGGEMLRVHAGAFVAPYLAAHLATHQLPPLLWIVDFATLWQRSSADARARAEHAAHVAGLERYLAWARERAVSLERASRGDPSALGSLGFAGERRNDIHSIWRHVALAATVSDKARVLAAFLVPRPVRGDIRAFARLTAARLRTRMRSLAGASREYGSRQFADNSPERWAIGRSLRLDRTELVTLTGDVVRAGGAVWVRAPGGSMMPTIPRGSLVRIDPVPDEGIAKGDVVLALTADGEPVLHRVVSASDGWITTRGDGAIHIDPPVPLTRVIGVATSVRDAEGERTLARSASRSMAITVLKLRRRVERVVRRAR